MRLLAAIACAVLVAGCSPGAQTYEDIPAVTAALRDEGIACVVVENGETGTIARDHATCRAENGEYDIYVFENEDDRDRWLRVGSALGEIVVGPNWAIDPGNDAPAVAEALRGEIR